MDQTARVSLYFDEISSSYRSRYAPEKPFHNFFFRERLRVAIEGFDFNGKSVFDIGAGTGALYDELTSRFSRVEYFGCDISRKMLDQSSIPLDRRFTGNANDASVPIDKFNFIFSLGVTTYQAPQELTATWRFIADRLAPGGTAIISFTNRESIDHKARAVMRIIKPIIRRGVFGQSFATYAYCVNDVATMASNAGLSVTRTAFINKTVSPFNILLPRPSVSAARALDRYAPDAAKPALSADFIAFVQPV